MTTALRPYPKPVLRDVTHLTPDETIDGADPWPVDMHGIEEEKAPYTVSLQHETAPNDTRFDAAPRAYNRALKSAGLSGAERAVLDDIMEHTRWAYPQQEHTTRAASVIAEACGISTVHAKRSIALLAARHILIQVAPNNPHRNHGATWRVNLDPSRWLGPETLHTAVSENIPRIINDTTPSMGGGIKNGPILETLRENLTDMHSCAGARESDVSPDSEPGTHRSEELRPYPKEKQAGPAPVPDFPAVTRDPIVLYWKIQHEQRGIAQELEVTLGVAQRLAGWGTAYSEKEAKDAIFAAFEASESGKLTGPPPSWLRWCESYMTNARTYGGFRPGTVRHDSSIAPPRRNRWYSPPPREAILEDV
jgi:hypothetical protein